MSSPLFSQDDDDEDYIEGGSTLEDLGITKPKEGLNKPKKPEIIPEVVTPTPVKIEVMAPVKAVEIKKVEIKEEVPKKVEIPTVKIALLTDYPPYSYIGKDGEVKGFYKALFDEISKRLNGQFKIEYKRMNFNGAFDLAKLGLVGVVGIFKTNEREKIFDYSDALFDETVTIFVKKGKRFKYSGLKDLKGKYIGMVKGYSYGNRFDKAKAKKWFRPVYVNSDLENIKQLTKGRVHCIVIDDIIANRILFQHMISDKVIRLKNPVSVNKTYMVWAKKSKMKDFIEKFNHTLTVLQVNGTYSKIVSKFIRSSFTD